MTLKTTLLAVPAWLIGLNLLVAQTPVAGTPQDQRQMVEDIEIMRLLLTTKLESQFHFGGARGLALSPDGVLHSSAMSCTRCHFTPKKTSLRTTLGLVDSDGDGWVDFDKANSCPALRQVEIAGRMSPVLQGEGVYLKGLGIVYTLTLPPSVQHPGPQAPVPAPKPPSDWERTRMQIRGEKPESLDAAKERKQPSVADVVFKILVENGHNFKQLGENESITVVITFRDSVALQRSATARSLGLGLAFADLDNDGDLDLYIVDSNGPKLFRNRGQGKFEDVTTHTFQGKSTMAGPGGSLGGSRPGPTVGGPSMGSGAGAPMTDPASSGRDHELLADLHYKQDRVQQAIDEYKKALGQISDSRQSVALWQKLAQAHFRLDDLPRSRECMNKALDLLNKQEQESTARAKADPKPGPPALPAKLIISAPKKLLDHAATGEINLEDFKKAAHVEYLSVPPLNKKQVQKTTGIPSGS